MRTRRRERGGKALRKTVEEARVRGLNGVQLAFVGDTIYDLYARTQVLEEHDAVSYTHLTLPTTERV